MGHLKKKSLTIAEKGKSQLCDWHNQILLPDLKESNFRYVHCREICRRMWFTFLYSLFSHFAAEFEKFWLFCRFSCYNSIFLNFTTNTLKRTFLFIPSTIYSIYTCIQYYCIQNIQYFLTISPQRKSGFYDTTLCDPMDCSLPGSSVHGIFQAIVLEWIAISFFRGSYQPRDRTRVSRIVNRRFTVWATREVLWYILLLAQSCRLFATPWTAAYHGSAVHGIFQARLLEWAAISLSKEGSMIH